MGKLPLTESQIREVAVEASADPRTVRKVLKGEATKSMAAARIRKALERLKATGAIKERTPQ